MVSVIIPVYNVKNYLEKCVESVIGQSYKNLEIILVDDGSTDGSGALCDNLAENDHRIVVVHKQNGGLSDARNKGLDIAKGEYILFVDSDDYINPQLIERSLNSAKKHDADIVMFDYEAVEENSDKRELYSFNLPKNVTINPRENKMVYTTAPCAWNKLYKAELFRNTGIRYPVGLHYEDLATSPRLFFYSSKVVYIDSPPLYYYLLREGSIMRNTDYTRNFTDRTRVLESLMAFFKENDAFNEYKDELEFLVAEHGFFVPSKEIVYENPKSPYLLKFRDFALNCFPTLQKNKYLKIHSKKDKILFSLVYNRQYLLMRILSSAKALFAK